MERTGSAIAFVLAASIIGVLLFCCCTGTPAMKAHAIRYDGNGLPVSLSGDEFIVVRDTALSDSRVQGLIGGRNYYLSDCCGFVKDGPSAEWQPVMNIIVSNKLSIAVAVDLTSHKVTNIVSGELVQHRVPSDEKTAAEQIVAQSANNDSRTSGASFLAINNASNALPFVLVTGIALGGAAAGAFYFLKSRPKGHSP
jgi:hypothetical protein